MRSVSITFITIFVLSFFLPSLVKSQGLNTGNRVSTSVEQKIRTRQENIQKIQNRIETNVRNRVASREARMDKTRSELVGKYYANMSGRLEAYIKRLEVLIERIETRLAIVDKETDSDLSSAYSDLQKAKTMITDSKALLVSANEMLDDVISSENPSEVFTVLRSNILDIKQNLNTTHGLLINIIRTLSGLRVGVTQITPTTGV